MLRNGGLTWWHHAWWSIWSASVRAWRQLKGSGWWRVDEESARSMNLEWTAREEATRESYNKQTNFEASSMIVDSMMEHLQSAILLHVLEVVDHSLAVHRATAERRRHQLASGSQVHICKHSRGRITRKYVRHRDISYLNKQRNETHESVGTLWM